MRRIHQQKILELLATLEEAHSEIKHLLLTGDADAAIQVMAECQNFAVPIGEYVESLKGEGTKTVDLLAEYCKYLYEASLEAGGKAAGAALKRLSKQLVRIQNTVRSELKPDKVEVAFFPYKAAMADALESIWKSALADPQCEAYIVPIPYYDRLPGGEFGQMYYEGDLYPPDVPITDWREYNVEERHPDIIFIHYPYDNDNYVTSLHPNYYSKRLKDCTDLLVYVPYFVSIEDVEPLYCQSSGVLYADRVILQSEIIRQSYIRSFRLPETLKNRRDVHKYINEKFVALGSPKFDKVINSRPEAFALPEAWKRLLETPGGARKKAVLYNTTLTAALNGNQQYLKKIRSVLDDFKGRDDIVLWWRPHPLSNSTFRSMRPAFLKEYEQIVADYRCGGWGIYDDTHDLHRAIALTDAYYGDWSSVVALYAVTRKTILVQNPNIPGFGSETDRNSVTMSVYNNTLYSMPYGRNAIIAIDLNQLKAAYFGHIPGKPIYQNLAYRYTRVIDTKMYLIPFFSNDVVIYDFDTGKFEIVPLALNENLDTQGNGNFFNFCLYKTKLFFLPFGYRAIVSYDFVTGITEHCLSLEDYFPAVEDPLLFHQYVYMDDVRILLPSLSSNKVLEYNLDTNEFRIYRLGPAGMQFSSITKFNNDYWLVARNSLCILRWNPDTGTVTELRDFPKGCIGGSVCFGVNGILSKGKYLYCFPSRAKMAVRVDMENGDISKLDEFDKYIRAADNRRDISVFDGAALNGDFVYLFCRGEMLLEYNLETREIRESYMSDFSSDDSRKMSEDCINSIIHGQELDNSIQITNVNTDGTAGQQILEYTKAVILTPTGTR